MDLQEFFDDTNDLIQSVNPDGSFAYVNRAWRRALKYGQQEVARLTFMDVVHPDCREHCRKLFRRVISGKRLDRVETAFITADGLKIVVEGSVHAKFENGRPMATLGIFRNITARRQAEEERDRLFALSLDMMCVAGLDGYFRRVNPAFERILGFSSEELLCRPFLERVHPEDRPATAATMAQLSSGVDCIDFENRYRCKDGTYRWLAWDCPAPPEGTSLLYAVARDVTSRRRSVEHPHNFHAPLCSVINASAQLSIIATDLSGTITVFNSGAEQMLGYSADEMVGHCTPEAIHLRSEVEERSRELSQQLDRKVEGFDVLVDSVREGNFERREWTYVRKDRSLLTVSLVVTALTNDTGEITGFLGIAEDITQRKQSEDAIAQLASIVKTSDDAIVSASRDGHITTWNAGAERLFGYSSDEAIGRNISMLSDTERWSEFRDLFDKLARGETVVGRETLRFRKDRQPVLVSITASPLTDRDGCITGFSSIIRDITERWQAMEALKYAKEAAEEASHAKSAFLANMSHEIRTPMNGIMGMTELALRTQLTAEQREYLEIVQQSAKSLLTVINDILDFSKIEAGMLELESVEFNLREMIADTMRSLALRAHHLGLELAWHVPPSVPVAVAGSQQRLRQIVINLVHNAIKFTEQGEVLVSVTVDAQTQEDVLLRFAVSDTGIGIPMSQRESIFEAFTQGDASTTRSHGGTGLGLAISARLSGLMGGRLWLTSEMGEGSTFYFTAKFRLPPEPRQNQHSSTQASQLKGLPVLVVDDNATNRGILVEILNGWSMRPVATADGFAALEVAEQALRDGQPFPLVLLDCHMPRMDGFTVAERLRQHPEMHGAIVMMLTSGAHANDSVRCEQHRIGSYLLKPIKQSELLASLATALQRKPRAAKKTASKPSRAQKGSEGLRVLVAEDHRVNQLLMQHLLSQQGYEIETVDNGKQAVDAVGRQDFDVVLMDVQMPWMDGLDATREIRALERRTTRRVPIIAMTAYAMKGDRERCLNAGMDGYVSKPINAAKLFAEIQKFTPHKPADEPVAATDDTHLEETSSMTFDRQKALSRVGGNVDILRELAEIFLAEYSGMRNQLGQAVSCADRQRIQFAAHRLKSAVGNFFARRVVDAVSTIERLGQSGDLDSLPSVYESVQVELDSFIPELRDFASGDAMTREFEVTPGPSRTTARSHER